jgi:hypothetical protein
LFRLFPHFSSIFTSILITKSDHITAIFPVIHRVYYANKSFGCRFFSVSSVLLPLSFFLLLFLRGFLWFSHSLVLLPFSSVSYSGFQTQLPFFTFSSGFSPYYRFAAYFSLALLPSTFACRRFFGFPFGFLHIRSFCCRFFSVPSCF